MSNTFTIADRELVSGSIEGVNFGPELWVIARSPLAVLVWVFGHGWSVNGHRSYAQPHLTLLPDRSPGMRLRLRWKSFPHTGRLTPARAREFADEIAAAFQQMRDPLMIKIGEAIRLRKTLIIEGGGGALMPTRYKPGAEGAYQAWRANPNNGFIVKKELT